MTPDVFAAKRYSTRPKRGPIEAFRAERPGQTRGSIPRVLSVAPLKLLAIAESGSNTASIPRVLSVAPLKPAAVANELAIPVTVFHAS